MLKRRLKEPFGKAGLTVAILALVMALVGGAYAAGGLTKSQEKQVTKIAKKYAGKPGSSGPQGPVGPAGAAGTNGTNGKNGSAGDNGKSVVVTAATSGPSGECEEGGASIEVEGTPASKKHVCNGSPWTAGGTLPKGQTETGNWAASGTPVPLFGGALHLLLTPISFTIPLSSPPSAVVIGVEEGEGEANEAEAIENGECAGTFANPGAGEGHLCVFIGGQHENLQEVATTISSTGSILVIHAATAEGVLAGGSWAVTAG
jgi:hypothetical protein